ncbi:hypothetical protein PLICRDRAFT_41894 [Plicaturopsis crispa FD-325 SS-3]|nr:hypothetical protein PLICRDRAFT_41894 [Plicaturopsis crispa FD-325 SS-3]
MNSGEDTDTLLATLASLLTVPAPEQSVLLDTLVQCNGNVQTAANLLNQGATLKASKIQSSSEGKKRKRTADLDDWLRKPSSSKKPASASSASIRPIASTSKAPNSGPPKIPRTRSVSPEKARPVVDLMTVLRQPSPSAPSAARLPPLTLATPSLVAQHTPCTLHPSVLPPELACRLFYTMLDASEGWKKNKWFLFDRLVESPHRTAFFARNTDGVDGDESWQEAAKYWYNGRQTTPPAVFPPAMEEACTIIERVVNDEIKKRDRFPLEWAGTSPEGQVWRANVAASNCYEGGKESVGFHSDQLTYLGPYPTIASLSLGTSRVFRLREVVPTHEKDSRSARTYNIPLPHNSLTIMHASVQERFKHSIPPQPAIDMYHPTFPPPPSLSQEYTPFEPSNCRINITFRFYRPDFKPSSTPRCKCGVPTILKPDMKNRHEGSTDRYWWTCYAGAQNDGKGCNFWKVMDMKQDGRGPVVRDDS